MSTLAGWLDAIATGPDLDGALCRRDPHMWDDTTDPQPAVEACLYQCKAYDACREWAQAQPAGSLAGIVAGEIYLHPSDRKQQRKTSA